MATLLHSESRRLYSWWWSSHISPKNSKWLQENLTDMDTKVKAMIKLIEEDADSFARRAEMYYKRRPELMKLVEEFYRAYRALAERYNHATVELRLAHRTMAEAFPDQVPYSLSDESPSNSSSGPDAEPHTPEMPHPIRPFLDPEGSDSGSTKKGLKQVHDMFESEDAVHQSFQQGLSQLSHENKNLKTKVVSESERASRAEVEVQTLKSILSQMQAEKDSILAEYEKSLEKLSNLKGELNCAQEHVEGLDERAGKAEIEIKILKEALAKLETERDMSLLKYNESLKKISNLELMLEKAESQTQNLKHELSRLETEREAGLLQYHQCLETISALESKISLAELDARKLSEQANEAERRVLELGEAVKKLNEEKEAVACLYKQCLETLGEMEAELSRFQEEAKRLNSEIMIGAEKLKSAEEKRSLLEKSNRSLQCEAENLAKKIEMKDQELLHKDEKLEKLQSSMKDGHMRFNHVDASLQTLQKLYYESQEEQRALALEIRSGLQMLKDLEARKLALEEEIQRVKEENCSLSEINSASTLSEKNLREELCSLKEMKKKLEEDFAAQAEQCNALQREINQLREEITGLNGSYGLLLLQVEELRDENTELRGGQKHDEEERETLHDKLKIMDEISEKNSALERSLCELNGALRESREMVKQLQESCQSLEGEKSTLVTDKATLLSQLQKITEDMQKLLEKNASLECSLSAGRAEVEGLREKSRRVDEFCQLVINEKSNLLTDRSCLASQLENVERRLSNLERRFENMEEKCSRLEKEKETTLNQVEELRGYLGLEKQERTTYIQSSETRLAGLESHVKFLQEEIRLRKKEFEEEVEKAVNSQLEIFILQKFVEDLEEKNLSLLFECQKQVEASKLSNKLITELESENLEQQVEVEMLSDEVGRLRTGIYQVFRALQIDPQIWYRDEVGKANTEKVPLLHILDKIENMKSSLLRNKDEKLSLLIENSLLLTVLGQVRVEGEELETGKKSVEKELEKITAEYFLVEKEKTELLEENELLKLQITGGGEREKELQYDLQNLSEQLDKWQHENLEIVKENRVLHEKMCLTEEENRALLKENDEIFREAVTAGNLSVVYKSLVEEEECEIKTLSEDLQELYEINRRLREEVRNLKDQLGVKGEENLCLVRSVEKLSGELHEVNDLNDQLNHQIVMGNDFLREKARELSEVENKLERSQCSTTELCRTVQELSREHEESKKGRRDREEEIERLLEANRELELEISRLREEVEERRAREESLSSELLERSNENELWESEASSFYFDLQISGVREVLLENKVHELTEICENLKNSGGEEIEHMKERVGFLEREIGGLKSQLSAYIPVISSLRDDMPSLKQNALLWRQLCAEGKLEKKDVEERANRICENHQELGEDQSAAIQAGISNLQRMHSRIEAVEKAVMEEMGRLKMERVEDPRTSVEETKDELLNGKVVTRDETKNEVPRSRTGLLMKDIPLDQVSDSSFSGTSQRNLRDSDPLPDSSRASTATEITEQKKSEDLFLELQFEKELGVDKLELSNSRELEKEVYRRKILERLVSDAQKLSSIRTNVEDIKKEVDASKGSRKKKNANLEAVKTQLQEVEDAVVQLMVINDHLTKDIDGSRSSVDGSGPPAEVDELGGAVHEKKVREQAKRESEKIGRLQFEVQNIQYILVKMEDEKKSKGKNRFSRSGTGVLLRDFIYSGRRNSERKLKKGCFCGCSRTSTKGD
ncbi:hypothetical protein CRG98_000699 [Punica granatum]|uniref:NAB domain-containing protein n=1 Tax=Punica granatum TaxID=22663 RepID=A0A2I0LFD6_PUNGR|nr:hypothetical protein CRG98_000699 [Punica granatum]